MVLRFRSDRVQLPLAALAALEGFSLIGRVPITKRETVALSGCLFLCVFSWVMGISLAVSALLTLKSLTALAWISEWLS